MAEQLLTCEQAAVVLHVKTHTLREWAAKKIVPHYKLGKRYFFREHDLHTFMSNNYVSGDNGNGDH